MLLHELIQTMSRAEKRYFKLYAQIGQKKPPKYVNLFDLINKQEVYDEQVIKKKGFKSDDKNLLSEKIMDAIHTMQLHKSVDAELRLLMDYFSILYTKRHWQSLEKYIRKAKQIAKENERFNILLEILKWEQGLAFKTIKTDFDQKINEIAEQKEEVLAQLNNELEYYDLSIRVDALLLGDAKLNKPETQEKFNQLVNSPLLHQNAKPLSKRAMIDYCYIKVFYHRNKKEDEQTLHYYRLILGLFDKNKFLFHVREYTAFYVKIYFWEKALSLKLKKATNDGESLQIKNLPNQSILTGYNIHLQSLTYYVRTANRGGGEELILQAEQQWEHYTKHIKETRLSIFSYTVMVFYCMFEEWEKAQIWLDKVTAIHRVTDRKDIQIAARLWQLIICYELEPYDLDKHIQSAYKYFVRNENYFEVEQQILQLFRGLYKAITHDEKKIIWQEMSDFIEEKFKEEGVPQRGLKNLQLWCESKIDRISTVQVIQQEQKEKTVMYI